MVFIQHFWSFGNFRLDFLELGTCCSTFPSGTWPRLADYIWSVAIDVWHGLGSPTVTVADVWCGPAVARCSTGTSSHPTFCWIQTAKSRPDGTSLVATFASDLEIAAQSECWRISNIWLPYNSDINEIALNKTLVSGISSFLGSVNFPEMGVKMVPHHLHDLRCIPNDVGGRCVILGWPEVWCSNRTMHLGSPVPDAESVRWCKMWISEVKIGSSCFRTALWMLDLWYRLIYSRMVERNRPLGELCHQGYKSSAHWLCCHPMARPGRQGSFFRYLDWWTFIYIYTCLYIHIYVYIHNIYIIYIYIYTYIVYI